ncbi:unnamed protein product [Closterium sp. NIES-54]
MPLYSAAERDGTAGDAYGRRDYADDAASHGREAPLVASCYAISRLGAQLPRTGVSAFGDNAARAAVREETGSDAGTRVRWGLHLGVSPESKGWEVLDLTENKVVTTVEAIFYGTMSLEAWKAEHGPILTQNPAIAPMDPSSMTTPLLAVEDNDVEDVTPPSTPTSTSPLPLVADLPKTASPSATGDEGSIAASPSAPARGIVGGRQEELAEAKSAKESTAGEKSAEELAEAKLAEEPTAEDQLDDDASSDVVDVLGSEEGELTVGEQSDDSDVVEVYGVDYNETYAPVGSYVTLRIFLSIVVVIDLHLIQLDMKNMFLQSKLDRVLYMYQSDYYNDGTGRVCKLLKSLYGLKQLPLLWYKALDDVLIGADWKKSQVNEALYFKVGDDGLTCWVLVYADDLLAASSSLAMLKELKELLEDAFELCEIKLVEKYLGLEIIRDRPVRKLWLHQQVYVDKLRRPVTHDTALEFSGGPESLCLVGYADADDAGDKQNRTSTGGYVFIFGGAAVSWSSQCIECATLSSTESEYVAATEAGKEAHRLCFVLAEFQLLDAGKPTILHADNQSAITVVEGLGLKGNLKHMERRYAWLQHMVKRGKIALQYILTTEQLADFLTKALHLPAFKRCSVAISHVRLADVSDGDDEVQQ